MNRIQQRYSSLYREERCSIASFILLLLAGDPGFDVDSIDIVHSRFLGVSMKPTVLRCSAVAVIFMIVLFQIYQGVPNYQGVAERSSGYCKEESKTSPATTTTITTTKTTGTSSSLHPFTSLLVGKKKVFLYNMGGRNIGFGSLTLHMLQFAIFFQDTQGRHLVVDESKLTVYRRNHSVGAFTGFFNPTFPVLDTEGDLERVEQEMEARDSTIFAGKLTNWSNVKSDSSPVLKIKMAHPYGWAHFTESRKIVRDYYNEKGEAVVVLFQRMSSLLCESLPLNHATQRETQTLLTNASIPDFSSLDAAGQQDPPTIAFHIRRGDKIREQAHSPARKYVDKLIEIIPNSDDRSRISKCFVATDDYKAVVELRVALRARSINCTLHTLTTPAAYSSARDTNDMILFLAEMKVLIDATYFIGTFGSNVGKLVPLYRGCDADFAYTADKYSHFFRSYGVDGEDWRSGVAG